MTFSQNIRNWIFSLATLCALLIGAAPAWGGALATTPFALNDGFGPDAGRWHGSAAIAAVAFGDNVTADVDWAAFGPGDFQLYLNGEGIAQLDPSGPDEVTYVYQISSVKATTPGIDTLTVGLDAVDGRGTVLAPAFVPTGAATEKSPVSGGDNTTSMAWFFNGTELQAGDTSSLLVFTSPFAPELDFLQVNSGLAGPSPSPLVASPSFRPLSSLVPEPSSVLLGLLGCMILAGARRKSLR